jgi:hypothetical protein
MSIDETSLSNGELYTVLTNKDRQGRKGCLAAIVAGTKTAGKPFNRKQTGNWKSNA